ncbi:MAG: hypothetical protein CME06_05960 [Gemmatimonadetes bacterium]|nr:hypothetical protein [Gemmatimonadota bacterium]
MRRFAAALVAILSPGALASGLVPPARPSLPPAPVLRAQAQGRVVSPRPIRSLSSRSVSPSATAGSGALYIALLVEFESDASPSTTGDGTFQAAPTWPDSLPHDPPFFRRQLDHLEAYWGQASGGRAGFHVDLHGAVLRMPASMARYGADDESTRRAAELLRDSIEAADPGVDFSSYAGVIVIHAGAGQESDLLLDSSDDIWSSYISAGDLDEELGLPDGIATGDGVFFTEGVIVPETEIQDLPEQDPPPPESNLAILGVLAFETAHFFGLPDLFDTGPAPQDSWGIGAWGIMGLGAWNANGYVPPHPCAWSKLRLGWVDPIEPASGDTLELTAIEVGERVLRVESTPTEAFLAAYRLGDENGNGCFDFTDPEGDGHFDYYNPASGDSYVGAELDYYLPTGPGTPCEGSSDGVLIWHIDERIVEERSPLDINLVNADADRKGVDLEEAGGIQNLDLFPGSWGDSADFWAAGTVFGPETQPNSATNSEARTGWSVEVVGIDSGSATASILATIDQAQRGWPIEIGEPTTGDVLVADFDGDGASEVVVVGESGSAYLIWGGGAGSAPIPFGPSGTGTAGIAAGDFDGDEAPDLVLLTAGGEAHAYKFADGIGGRLPAVAPMPGSWGEALGEAFRQGPVIADVDGNGLPEVVVLPLPNAEYPDAQLAVLSGSGTLLALRALGAAVYAPITVTGEGSIALALSDRVLTYRWSGSVLEPSPPRTITGSVQSRLLAIDMDTDGMDELLVMEDEGAAHLLDIRLFDLPGWPVAAGARLSGGAAVALLGDDGRLDILATTSDPTELRRWDRSGDGVLDWHNPRLTESGNDVIAVTAGTLVADLDGDGSAEAIVALPTGTIRGVAPGPSGVGSDSPAGFPLQQAGTVSYTPAIADLDGDGDLELIVAEDDGRVMAWDFPGSGAAHWPQAGGGAARTGRYPGPFPDPGEPSEALLELAFVYPNPARGHARLHYRLGDAVDRLEIRVLDARGELISHHTVNDAGALSPGDHHWTWGLDGMARGLYLLLVEARSATSSARREVRAAVIGGAG